MIHTKPDAVRVRQSSWVDDLLQATHYNEATRTLTKHWLAMPRKTGAVCPQKEDFQFGKLGSCLNDIYMTEWMPDGALIVSVLGRNLISIIGSDITGSNVLESVPNYKTEEQVAYYTALRDQPCAGFVTRWGLNEVNRTFVYHTLQLPLLDRDGSVKYFVGSGLMRSGGRLMSQASQGLDELMVEHQEYNFFDIGAGVPNWQKRARGQFHSQNDAFNIA